MIFSFQDSIQKIKEGTGSKLREMAKEGPSVRLKEDRSPVTELDLHVSHLVKEIFAKSHPDLHFFSEEEQGEFQYPTIILDPIDGTREFIQGIPECAISLAIMYSPEISHPQNYAWIFNPFSGFEISTTDQNIPSPKRLKCSSGLISRTEDAQGLFREESFSHLRLIPRGSIAFKLGLLSASACDFVLSRRGKNIWDLAAGTLIGHSRGLSFWQRGEKMESLQQMKFHPNLLWAHPQHVAELEEGTKGKIWH